MITIISGTNREGSKTLEYAKIAQELYRENMIESELIDLGQLPRDVYNNNSIYGNIPKSFEPYQEKILNTSGMMVLVPEYNGSFPGILKYFIDLLKFPESLVNKPAGFIGIAAGVFGGLRAVEQLEMIFQYREAHLYGKRAFITGSYKNISDDGKLITDEYLKEKFESTLIGFSEFSKKFN